ncbi:MAG: sulfatase-like hydrolase/transferase [Cytophagales bacterium]|nr:sulfatase-like hydrolase/transferase [Cytophagales bacterium]
MSIRVFLYCAAALLTGSCKDKITEPPNIIFIMMDDLGYGQFGIHNKSLTTEEFDPYFVGLVQEHERYNPEQALDFSKRAMPTINKLGEEGIVFTRAFTSSSLCAPSRLGIATGILQNRMGVYLNIDCEQLGLAPDSHLAEMIKAQGYATAHIGKWHIGRRNDQMIIDALKTHGIPDTLSYNQMRKDFPEVFKDLFDRGYYGSVIDRHNPLQNGFDYYFGYNNWASQFYNSTLVWENYKHAGRQKGYNTDVFTDTALAFIQKQVVMRKPFYVQLHFHAVHDSLQPKAPDKYFNEFDSDSYDLNNFYAHVYGVDQNIKRILEYLKKSNIYENTILVFTSDNGAQAGGPSVLPGNAPFSGHKGTYYQGGIRVPLLIHWPTGIKRAFSSEMLVSTMDILPTIVEATGATVPDHLDGKSLLSFIAGRSGEAVRDHLVWAGLHSRAWGFLLNKSSKSRGAERNFAPPAWVVIKGDYMLRFTGTIEPDLYTDVPGGTLPELRLFRIGSDPAELIDISSEFPSKVDELINIFKRESNDFKPPVVWEKSKWEELITGKL